MTKRASHWKKSKATTATGKPLATPKKNLGSFFSSSISLYLCLLRKEMPPVAKPVGRQVKHVVHIIFPCIFFCLCVCIFVKMMMIKIQDTVKFNYLQDTHTYTREHILVFLLFIFERGKSCYFTYSLTQPYHHTNIFPHIFIPCSWLPLTLLLWVSDWVKAWKIIQISSLVHTGSILNTKLPEYNLR